jgi:hypothetical protein
MFGERYSFRSERLLAGGLLLGMVLALAITRSPKRCPYSEAQRAQALEARDAAVHAMEAVDPRVRADELYRAKQFEAAADLIAAIRPSDVELQNLALMCQKLGRAWAIGFDPAAPVTDAFTALREAWKLDTVLGGVHSDELQKRMGDISLLAADEFARVRDLVNADLAHHTADMLGR